MSNLYDAMPSSLRRPVQPSRFAQNLTTRANRPVMMASGSARAAALSKSRFARLPQEPEDARMTGAATPPARPQHERFAGPGDFAARVQDRLSSPGMHDTKPQS
jgi:hypothetical protein